MQSLVVKTIMPLLPAEIAYLPPNCKGQSLSAPRMRITRRPTHAGCGVTGVLLRDMIGTYCACFFVCVRVFSKFLSLLVTEV